MLCLNDLFFSPSLTVDNPLLNVFLFIAKSDNKKNNNKDVKTVPVIKKKKNDFFVLTPILMKENVE